MVRSLSMKYKDRKEIEAAASRYQQECQDRWEEYVVRLSRQLNLDENEVREYFAGLT